MKPAFMIAGAFVVGLGGATFVGMKQAPPEKPKTAADSTAAKQPHDSNGAASDSSVKAAATDSTPPAAKEEHQVATPPAAPAPTDPPPAPAASAERIATVLAKLPATDIVPLVEHMSDDELTPVLKRLDMGTTAAVLALLPPPRAKILSKRLLVSTPAAKP